MKRSVFVVVIMFFILTTCKKPGCDPGNMNSSMSLTGKWQLVQDSTANSMGGDAAPVITNYIGVTGDYFDFRSDGFCYTKEGSVYDTLSYQFVSAQSIILQKFGLVTNGSIEPSMLNHTTTTAKITTQNPSTPGGTFFREVNLKR